MSSLDLLRREPDLRSVPRGEVIFRAGDPPDFLYVVVEGEVAIEIGGRAVERVGEGGVFGEMALIDLKPRSATATAATDCRLAAINEKRFLRLVSQLPSFALDILRVMSARLRRRDDA